MGATKASADGETRRQGDGTRVGIGLHVPLSVTFGSVWRPRHTPSFSSVSDTRREAASGWGRGRTATQRRAGCATAERRAAATRWGAAAARLRRGGRNVRKEITTVNHQSKRHQRACGPLFASSQSRESSLLEAPSRRRGFARVARRGEEPSGFTGCMRRLGFT